MADFSTYMTLFNDTDVKMVFWGSVIVHGEWATEPKTVDPFTVSASFQMKDRTGPAGSEGRVTYKVADDEKVLLHLRFCDAYAGDNYCYIENPDPNTYIVGFRARVGGGQWQENVCPLNGHPLFIEYRIRKGMTGDDSSPGGTGRHDG